MADRLTQLQVCLDQLVEQFNASINYVNTNANLASFGNDENSVINLAVTAQAQDHPKQDITTTLNELSTDIILKSRQISMLIDSLPGIGVPPEEQMELIDKLSQELAQIEKTRIEKIKEKDELLKKTETLIMDLATGISELR